MNRGINRQAVFDDESDYVKFGELVREYKGICGARVYHWAWMRNHYHMVVEVVYDNLRAFVGGVQQAYAQYHHHRNRGCGVFWAGRFKSKPVEIGPYLIRCARYVERNPVRAGMVTEPWAYRWSSAAHHVKGIPDGITDTNRHLGLATEADRVRYGQELMSAVDDNLMRQQGKRGVIGGDAFARSLIPHKGRHRRRRGRPAKVRE
jgi:putative transposase